jgi:hypothetical protein
MTGARASRSKCTASRVPVNPAPTMAIRGVAVTGARIVRDACMVCSKSGPIQVPRQPVWRAWRRAGTASVSALLDPEECKTSGPTIFRRMRISAISMKVLPVAGPCESTQRTCLPRAAPFRSSADRQCDQGGCNFSSLSIGLRAILPARDPRCRPARRRAGIAHRRRSCFRVRFYDAPSTENRGAASRRRPRGQLGSSAQLPARWIWISTRRFCGSRTPSAVGTSGLDSPRPIVVIEVAGTPSRTSSAFTASARRTESFWL